MQAHTVAEFTQRVSQCRSSIERLWEDASGTTRTAAVNSAVTNFTKAIRGGFHEDAIYGAVDTLKEMYHSLRLFLPRHQRCGIEVISLADAIRRCIEYRQQQYNADGSQKDDAVPAIPKARRKGSPQSPEQLDYTRKMPNRTGSGGSPAGYLTGSSDTNNQDIDELYNLKHDLESLHFQLKSLRARGITSRWRDITDDASRQIYAQLERMRSEVNRLEQRLDAARSLLPWRHWREAARVARNAQLKSQELDSLSEKLAQIWASSIRATGNESYAQASATSARRAECALLARYRELYGEAEVEDLSITQLSEGRDQRWESADIKTPCGLIDVKNARSAFASPKRYSEWFVKNKDKRSPRGAEIVLSAVLSPYLQSSFNPGLTEAIWLGELSARQLDSLSRQFGREYLRLDFGLGDEAMHRGDRLPGWLFDYPQAVYNSRDKLRNQWRAYESAVVTGASGISAGPDLDDPVMEREYWALSSRFDQNEPISRPAIFLHILDRFCIAAREGWEFPEAQLRDLLWPPGVRQRMGEWQQAPYAVADPGVYVHELLNVLMKIGQECQEQVLQFSSFRLCGRNIFRGRESMGGSWKTLFAYCGGWSESSKGTRVKCGMDPLHAGKNRWCDRCGKLVCEQCHHCEHGCERMVDRKRQLQRD